MNTQDSNWTEAEYADYLAHERHLFAWVLVQHGGLSADEAKARALERYPWEPADDPWRGLIFHDEAWHWAMLALHGEGYWRGHPERANADSEYRQISNRLRA